MSSKPEAFRYAISPHAPFRNREVCDRVRGITRAEIGRRSTPQCRIEVLSDEEIAFRHMLELFTKIREASLQDRNLVLILPNPHPQYSKIAFLINQFRVDCRRLHIFNMDEWADEEGNEAPESWPNGLMNGMLRYFYTQVDEKLRPPRSQIHGPNRKNYRDYGKMIQDEGGADLCDGGIGWSGHFAFIDPASPEFAGEWAEFKEMGCRPVTLNPFTLAQAGLDADFGMSGDWSWIPPKGLTIGPREVLAARLRTSWNHFTLAGTPISWQRFSVRLALFGPVTPQVPASILQVGPTEAHLSEGIAADIISHPEISWYS